MKRLILILLSVYNLASLSAQDWKDVTVPANAGQGKVWQLQNDVSDDFNYTFEATKSEATIGGKWTNFYHNNWTGPSPTVWQRDHVWVENGNIKIKASRGPVISFNSGGKNYSMPASYLGCVTSTKRVQYPVYVETRVKIMKSVLASDVWMLSADDTQEIDICEAYGGDRWNNSWFSNKRLHLSHHVFVRSPFQDWQPSDEGSFYTDGTTIWSDGYHRIGVYWKDPWNLEYYVDGKLVRTRSGKNEIDPNGYTNGSGLSKPMDIIINTEDQTWRATQGLTPTDDEIANTENNTFNVDWIRIYKLVDGEVGPVTGVSLNTNQVNSFVGGNVQLTAFVTPNNAADVSVSWSSDNQNVASVNNNGLVNCLASGTANIIVTTNDGGFKDTCKLIVAEKQESAFVAFDNEDIYLNTNFSVGGTLTVSCNFHAGTGNTVNEGIKFWLREIKPGWSVANDYTAWDYSAAGKESGTATATISLNNVPASNEIPAENWYFLYLTFTNSAGKSVDKGIWPIHIVRTTATPIFDTNTKLRIFPNPVNEFIYLQAPQRLNELWIYNNTGQLVLHKNIKAKNPGFSVSDLNPGLYFLNVLPENGTRVTQKFLKK